MTRIPPFTCIDCKRILPEDAFPFKNKRKQRHSICRKCKSARGKIWNHLHPGRQWRSRYGLTGYELEVLMMCTGLTCAICGQFGNEVDHDHATGRVRGILCRNCNLGLGCFKDNLESLTYAGAYLDDR